ncbi:hypothetical protein HZS_930 [Henneguya salminicola]|nr:hypothetical protein HZS_930 [Henneguya salminicola]
MEKIKNRKGIRGLKVECRSFITYKNVSPFLLSFPAIMLVYAEFYSANNVLTKKQYLFTFLNERGLCHKAKTRRGSLN